MAEEAPKPLDLKLATQAAGQESLLRLRKLYDELVVPASKAHHLDVNPLDSKPANTPMDWDDLIANGPPVLAFLSEITTRASYDHANQHPPDTEGFRAWLSSLTDNQTVRDIQRVLDGAQIQPLAIGWILDLIDDDPQSTNHQRNSDKYRPLSTEQSNVLALIAGTEEGAGFLTMFVASQHNIRPVADAMEQCLDTIDFLRGRMDANARGASKIDLRVGATMNQLQERVNQTVTALRDSSVLNITHPQNIDAALEEATHNIGELRARQEKSVAAFLDSLGAILEARSRVGDAITTNAALEAAFTTLRALSDLLSLDIFLSQAALAELNLLVAAAIQDAATAAHAHLTGAGRRYLNTAKLATTTDKRIPDPEDIKEQLKKGNNL